MNTVVSIIVGLVFAYIVYFGFCKKGLITGYVLNFLGCFASYYFQNQNMEITLIVIATILLVAAIVTVVEYISFQNTQSFIGYLVYVAVIVIAIIVVIFLGKTLFTFLGNPSILFDIKK